MTASQGLLLKPCPFCGGAAEFVHTTQNRDGHVSGYVLVRCTNCKAGTRRTEYSQVEPIHHDEDAKASRLWNRRFE